MPRVLVFDGGMHLGFGALGGGRPPVAGSVLLRGGPTRMGALMRHADQVIRQLILQEKPDALGFATPFVGQVRRFDKKNGRSFFQPVSPHNIRPLFGTIAKVEEIADELKIRCIEEDEGRARDAFLDGVPKKSRDIKDAVGRGCYQRGWPSDDEHGCDSLCVAAWILELLERGRSHETTPIFQEKVTG